MKQVTRYHFTVPESDTQVAEWIEEQHNLSASMRMLIKDYVARYGMVDITSLPAVLTAATSVPIPMPAATTKQALADDVNKEEKSIENETFSEIENVVINDDDESDDPSADMLSSLMR